MASYVVLADVGLARVAIHAAGRDELWRRQLLGGGALSLFGKFKKSVAFILSRRSRVGTSEVNTVGRRRDTMHENETAVEASPSVADVPSSGDAPPSPVVAAAADGNAHRVGQTISSSHAYYDGDSGVRYTVTDAIDASGFGKFQLMMLLFTGLAWMGDAMEMMLLSFLGPSVRCEWGVSPSEEGRLTSVVFVGMLFGAPTWGMVADAKGRRFAFFLTTVITFVAGVVSAFSPSFTFLLLARTVVGFGLGGVPTAFTMFMEFLPSTNRGAWLVLINVFWTLGSIVEASLAWAILPKYSWRVLLLASTAPLFLLLTLMWLTPESPYYSASKGDVAGANKTLMRVSKVNKPSGGGNLPAGTLQLLETQNGVTMSTTGDPTTSDTTTNESDSTTKATLTCFVRVLTKPFKRIGFLVNTENRKLTAMLWFLFFAVAFLYYGVVLLTTEIHVDGGNGSGDRNSLDSGGARGGDDSLKCTSHASPDLQTQAYVDIFVSSIAELPGLLFAALCLDRLGRRRTLGVALVFAAVCFLIITGYETTPVWTETSSLATSRCFMMTAFTVLYVYAPETQTTCVRATALGLGNGFARIGGILTPLFAVQLAGSGYLAGVAWTFAVLTGCTAAVAFYLPLETAGASLDAKPGGDGLEMTEMGKSYDQRDDQRYV